MPQPVKLSDPLIDVARKSAAAAHRSLAAQVEHWATLGHAIEGALTAEQVAVLKHQVREPESALYVTPDANLPERLASVLLQALSTPARRQFGEYLAASGGATYGTDPAFPHCLVRRNADGSLTPGNWEGGQFVEVAAVTAKPSRANSRTRKSRLLQRA